MDNFIFNSNSYMIYNKKLALRLGINQAIYLSYALNFVKDDRCILPMKDMLNNTGLSEKEVKDIESKLLITGCIIENNSNNSEINILIDFQKIFSIINEDNKATLNKIKNITKNVSTGKLTVRQKQCIDLKNKLQCSNEELLEAYCDWIDGVYANPKGFLSTRSIAIFQKTIDEFAKGDLDLVLKLIDIATVNGYRDATWAINLFNKDYAAKWNKEHPSINRSSIDDPLKKVQLNGEVF